ncbi:MAG TPA: DEAD/DEAH box helicase [Gemmatimonadaceae bacterium]|nr:DEAD/DEAH box helicase [Gemmatimonadaceae bacterium]
MPFTAFRLHASLVKGIRELDFKRPTPIQERAIPAALEGRDVLACAMTGSGKTAAFLIPIIQRLIDRPRGVTRALVLTPTRELAAQVEQHMTALALHTPISGAAIFGGVGMGPQEHAFRSGVDVIIATPGRLLDHLKHPYASLAGVELLVLDEADRMLDMGFLPDIRRVLKHLPAKRQTLFFSATIPAPIAALSREMLHDPVTIDVERRAGPAVGITQAVYPVPEELKPALFLELLRRDDIGSVIVFTRTKHRTNRLFEILDRAGVPAARLHGNRSQAQRTEALEGFRAGRVRVLVATDIAARGIDVEALGHVVNFDVPTMPEDYIHRVGRTARAEATGDAYTFVSPEEEGDLAAIERAVGRRLPRVTVSGFDYKQRPTERFEVPIAERIAAIRARKAEDRARAKAKAERKAQREAEEAARLAAKAERAARGGRPSGDGRQKSSSPATPTAAGVAGEAPRRRRRRGGRGRGQGRGSDSPYRS